MAEYKVGQQIEYDVYAFNHGEVTPPRHEESTISRLRRGGFHGKWLALDGRPYGLKTTQPTPLHEFLRQASWGFREFPSQVQNEAIQLDYLATNLIADALPLVSNHEFIAPHSFGFTHLDGENAQLIEEMQGRPPRFKPDNEFDKFRTAQKRLANIAFYLGLEQVGQIHPNNPFGFDNLWYSDEKGCFIWLDTLAAFKHEPLFRLIRFGFHQDIHDHFYPGDPNRITFNTIHLDTYLKRIELYRNQFDLKTYERVQENAKMYKKISQSGANQETARNFMPILTDLVGITQEMPEKLASFGGDIKDLVTAVFSSEARRRLVFQGAQKAEELGILTSEILEQARADFEVYQQIRHGSMRFKAAEVLMAAYYLGSKLTIDSIQWTAVIANTLSDNELWSKILIPPLIAIAGQIPSSLSRVIGTLGTGLLTRTDLRAAASVAWIPAAGNVLPFSAQALVNYESASSLLWHYSMRDYVAKLSRLTHMPTSFFAGGWGTQYEGELYNWRIPFTQKTLGPLLESLAVKT